MYPPPHNIDVHHARLQADVLRQELQAETGKVQEVRSALVMLEQACILLLDMWHAYILLLIWHAYILLLLLI
jgi:hypothetical protein